jgi:prepilin peptidase CpaA
MEAADIVLLACVLAFTAVAAVCDLWAKKLPNVLTVPAFAAALVYHLVVGALDSGLVGAGQRLLVSLAGFATGFGILLILWLIGGGGGGDVKYMGALGAWLGPSVTFKVLVVTAALAGTFSLGVFIWKFVRLGPSGAKRRYLSTSGGRSRRDKDLSEEEAQQQRMVRRRLMPFAVPAALATWIVLASTGFKVW